MSQLNQTDGVEEIKLLDDGKYSLIVVTSPAQLEDDAPAFLQVRNTAGENVCIGSVIKQIDETWMTRLTVTYDEASESDAMCIGEFDSRVHAVVQLWRCRSEYHYESAR